MKKIIISVFMFALIVTACQDKDINKFDQTADERAAAAIASLKNDLTAPSNGWKVKYKPETGSGSFWVLMKFDDDNNVVIKSDLGRNNGEFFEQTVTYRIDAALGLELIIENYSFFSYLFEQIDATLLAEFEFIYESKTPAGELVFKSKTDPSDPTILLFEEAGANDESLLGTDLSTNLNTMSSDINRITAAYKLTYTNKDLILYLSLDELRRTISINTSSKKTNTSSIKAINFSSPYTIKGDSIVFDETLSGTFVGTNIKLKGIKFDDLNISSLDACGQPITTHAYDGVTSNNDIVVLESTLLDVNGKSFASNTFMYAPLEYIFDHGYRASAAIAEDLEGAGSMQLYYKLRLNDGTDLYGIGFFLQNSDGSRSFVLKEFTPVLTDNNLVFNFKPGFRIFENQTPDADINNIMIYLDLLTQGNQTYVYKYADGIFEFYNPCSGWSFVFLAPA